MSNIDLAPRKLTKNAPTGFGWIAGLVFVASCSDGTSHSGATQAPTAPNGTELGVVVEPVPQTKPLTSPEPEPGLITTETTEISGMSEPPVVEDCACLLYTSPSPRDRG